VLTVNDNRSCSYLLLSINLQLQLPVSKKIRCNHNILLIRTEGRFFVFFLLLFRRAAGRMPQHQRQHPRSVVFLPFLFSIVLIVGVLDAGGGSSLLAATVAAQETTTTTVAAAADSENHMTTTVPPLWIPEQYPSSPDADACRTTRNNNPSGREGDSKPTRSNYYFCDPDSLLLLPQSGNSASSFATAEASPLLLQLLDDDDGLRTTSRTIQLDPGCWDAEGNPPTSSTAEGTRRVVNVQYVVALVRKVCTHSCASSVVSDLCSRQNNYRMNWVLGADCE
jgi:hypothetical protein